MVYLTRKAEFSASHYYHNPEFTPEENRRVFGKCNNPNGHGHNYTLEVTVKGDVDARSGIGGPAVGAPTLPHRAQTPGSAAWYAGDSGRVVSITGVDVGTAVG